LPEIPGIDFADAWERRIDVMIDPVSGLTASFISAQDLIASRLAAGRPRDLADADEIKKAQESRASKSPSPGKLESDSGPIH
jgi:hypothetical protein